jgi:hypothetical protein
MSASDLEAWVAYFKLLDEIKQSLEHDDNNVDNTKDIEGES